MQKYFKQITLGIVLLTIAVNAAAEALPFNGVSTATISDKYRTLVTPAGYVFIIWSVIYVGWLAYALYPLLRKTKIDDKIAAAFPYFVIGAIANMTWLWLWHTEQLGWSVIVMLILLVSLIKVYLTLGIGTKPVGLAAKLAIHLPISIYLGWISVATIANISSALVQAGWNGLSLDPTTYAVLVLLVAIALGLVMLYKRHDVGYALVIVWALLGIAANNTDVSVVTISGLGLVAVLLYALNVLLQLPAASGSVSKLHKQRKR